MTRDLNIIVIMQPYFLPYRNYYGLIQKADHFVILDDVQFCRKWQQRNMILDNEKRKHWITVPVRSRRPQRQLINEVCIHDEEPWQNRILHKIRQFYQYHPYFDYIFPDLEGIISKEVTRLIDLTVPLLHWSASKMGLDSPTWHFSSQIGGVGLGRSERLLFICEKLGATVYLSGPAAKSYLNTKIFQDSGIRVLWHEDSYPDYPQLPIGCFDHYVSVLDLLMNCGPRSIQYMKPVT
jgi:hypothetical protein